MKHTYVSAEKFILSREFFGMKLGLENITRFLLSIGSPQTEYDTIHVAGTNGKGSTAAMLATILRSAGYKTGLFTSPHLVSLRERIRVNGRIIPRRSVTAFVDRHRRELTKRKLSFFEVITAMALAFFQRSAVDLAVIETGLGGRLDASNVLRPLLTITTDISLDHTEILGHSLGKIAREKAGIIKKSTPHLIGLLPNEAERVIRERCQVVGAPLRRLSRNNFAADALRNRLDFTWNGYRLKGLSPSLIGGHQLQNAALAVRAVSILSKSGLRVPGRAVREGLSATNWPGRFQVIRRRGRPTVVLDVCHNESGVRALIDSFKTSFPHRRAYVIVGFVKRKSHQAMIDVLCKIAATFTLVPLRTKRSIDVKQAEAVLDFHDIPVARCGSLSTAYRRLSRGCSADDIIVVAGSHFLVGEFLENYG
ncbi:MAG: bifunctional folylpolyglutamate synthase/dihydrofolate synthase [candidate division Zixibacteria bacterium]|nr:bifunctional folylpolyglutamate synthase/dihydrofolate synthase [candidate division Zixibacteria bacterium]